MSYGFEWRRGLLRLMAVAVPLLLAATLPLATASAQTAQRDPAAGRSAAHSQTVELLMFEDPGCPWCRRWHAEVGPGYPHSSEGKRAPLRRVQIHAAVPAGVRLARPVRATPTFVLVADGREVGRITGYPGAEFFWPMLEGLLRKLAPSHRTERQQAMAATRPVQEVP